MPNRTFDVSVTIESDRSGCSRVVTDTMQAAEILLRRWPDEERGATHQVAVQACVDAMEGRRGVAAARRAFANAAKSARLFVCAG